MTKSKYTVFWFRRDLRLEDNCGLMHALSKNAQVLPIFIFDSQILEQLNDNSDRRVQFIYETVSAMKSELQAKGSDLLVFHGKPLDIYKDLHKEYKIEKILTNHDYEPYARRRDEEIAQWAKTQGIEFHSFKDQVIFEKGEILTDAQKTYTVFTPYKKKWLATITPQDYKPYSLKGLEGSWAKLKAQTMPTLKSLGFEATDFKFPKRTISFETLRNYKENRDFPYLDSGTSKLGLHLRFGTVSVRKLVEVAVEKKSDIWLSELIWREFFMQILWHFPRVAKESFRPEYEKVKWRNSEAEFKKWCDGQTGYPLVDAGMRELNQTGFMHNRVRMVTASFLTKHLLTHWLKGERYFAEKLLDYDLSANNGNWQWAAGTGCDAAPYFRVFNPQSQQEKFDPEFKYIKKWVPEYGTAKYPDPMVDHKEARDRCLEAFKKALKGPV